MPRMVSSCTMPLPKQTRSTGTINSSSQGTPKPTIIRRSPLRSKEKWAPRWKRRTSSLIGGTTKKSKRGCISRVKCGRKDEKRQLYIYSASFVGGLLEEEQMHFEINAISRNKNNWKRRKISVGRRKWDIKKKLNAELTQERKRILISFMKNWRYFINHLYINSFGEQMKSKKLKNQKSWLTKKRKMLWKQSWIRKLTSYKQLIGWKL